MNRGLPRGIEPERDLWPGIRERLEARSRRTRRRRSWMAAAAAVLVAVAFGAHHARSYTWRVETAGSSARFEPGTSLVTEPGQRSRVRLPGLGTIDLFDSTTLTLAHVGFSEHRARLERGRIDVVVAAPPRLLVIDTPHVRVIDLGCAYTLDVESSGTRVEVTSGAVVLVVGSERAVVAAGSARDVGVDGVLGDVRSLEGFTEAPGSVSSWRLAWRWAWSFFVG